MPGALLDESIVQIEIRAVQVFLPIEALDSGNARLHHRRVQLGVACQARHGGRGLARASHRGNDAARAKRAVLGRTAIEQFLAGTHVRGYGRHTGAVAFQNHKRLRLADTR